MNVSDQSVSIWRDQFILSSGDQPASLEDIRPTAEDHGALDPKTYDAIETDALFDVVNHTQTVMGHMVFYRALSRPVTNAHFLQQNKTLYVSSNQIPSYLDHCNNWLIIRYSAKNHLTIYSMVNLSAVLPQMSRLIATKN